MGVRRRARWSWWSLPWLCLWQQSLLAAFAAAFGAFDDSVLLELKWGGTAPESLLAEYMQNENVDGDRGVLMRDEAGDKYLCSLPNPSQESSSSSPNYKGKTPRELLSDLYDSRLCTYRIEMYWTYELCHGRYLLQYHEEKKAGEKNPKRQEYYLGQFVKEEISKAEKDLDVMNPPKRKVEDQMLPYYPVTYPQGTICDITGRPRETTVHYVCFPDAKNQIFGFDEVSSCEYELVVLTPQLCSHPAYAPVESPSHTVACYPVDGAPDKPTSLTLWEKEQSWDLRSQFQRSHQPKESSAKSAQGKTKKSTPVSLEEDEDEEEEEDSLTDIKTSYKTGSTSSTGKPSAPAPTDSSMTQAFLAGEYCMYGGSGWWKHEYCHGRQVLQFHEDPKDRTIRSEIVLGKWRESVHLAWIKERPHKRPMVVDGDIRQVSHFYAAGDFCDASEKPREVEVRLRCRQSQGNQNSVTLYLLEPKTCEYVLGVESPMLCSLLRRADPSTGLIPEQ